MKQPDDVARLNRMIEDVFWVRWGRDSDPLDAQDRQRIRAIMFWQARCCPLPGESCMDNQDRVGMLRAMRELTGAI